MKIKTLIIALALLLSGAACAVPQCSQLNPCYVDQVKHKNEIGLATILSLIYIPISFVIVKNEIDTAPQRVTAHRAHVLEKHSPWIERVYGTQ